MHVFLQNIINTILCVLYTCPRTCRRHAFDFSNVNESNDNDAEFSVADDDSGIMAGIDDIELEISALPDLDLTKQMQSARAALKDLEDGGTLSLAPASLPHSDYDKMWALYAFPYLFWNGTGAPPNKMSLETWMSILLNRWPNSQFRQCPDFILTMYNVVLRHQVNKNAYVQMRLTPHSMNMISTLSEAEVAAVATIISSNLRGAAFAKAMENQTPAVRALMGAFKIASSKVAGSAQSFLSLRSRASSCRLLFGCWTIFVNLNPSELNARVVYEIAGEEYFIDSDSGWPSKRPDTFARWKIIAKNPCAAAEFFHTFMRAFCDVFLGFPVRLPCIHCVRSIFLLCVHAPIHSYIFILR